MSTAQQPQEPQQTVEEVLAELAQVWLTQTEELEKQGLTPDQAVRQAATQLGIVID